MLKTELTHHYKFKDREETKYVIFEYIEGFYNRIRINSANNYMSPVDFEQFRKSLENLFVILLPDHEALGQENVTLKLFEYGRHEILNEKNKQEVYKEICGWLENNHS